MARRALLQAASDEEWRDRVGQIGGYMHIVLLCFACLVP